TRRSSDLLAEAVGSVPRPRGLPAQMLSLGYAARPLGGPCVEFGGPAGLSCAFTQMRLDGEISGQTVIEAAQFGETGRRADGLAEGHGPIEADDRGVPESEELVVPVDDLRPVGGLDASGIGVQSRDCRLGLVFAEFVSGERRLQDPDALGDER